MTIDERIARMKAGYAGMPRKDVLRLCRSIGVAAGECKDTAEIVALLERIGETNIRHNYGETPQKAMTA